MAISKNTTNYMKQYEGLIPQLSAHAAKGDASDLERQMNERADYNKPILDAQMAAREGSRQIQNAYSWVDNPGLKGLSISDREMLKGSAMSGKQQEERVLGAYYTARQEDLASAINAWKEAWQAKYNAMKETADGAQNLYGMSFDQDKFKETNRQFESNQALERWKEQQANARNAASISASRASAKDNTADAYKEISDLADRWVSGRGGANYDWIGNEGGREYIANVISSKYTISPADALKMVGGVLPNGWENQYGRN